MSSWTDRTSHFKTKKKYGHSHFTKQKPQKTQVFQQRSHSMPTSAKKVPTIGSTAVGRCCLPASQLFLVRQSRGVRPLSHSQSDYIQSVLVLHCSFVVSHSEKTSTEQNNVRSGGFTSALRLHAPQWLSRHYVDHRPAWRRLMKGNRAFGTHMLRKFKGIPEKF